MFGFYSDMQISAIKNQNLYSHPSFSGIRLYSVNLKKNVNGVSAYIPAYFTKMTEEDVPLVQKVKGIWRDTKYGEVIINNFLKSLERETRFDIEECVSYMIEDPSALNPKDRIKALAQVSSRGDELIIDFVQSLGNGYSLEKLKGAGVALIYGICQQAKNFKKQAITLASATAKTDEWYNSLGFIRFSKYPIFDLPSEKFGNLLSSIEKKYNY